MYYLEAGINMLNYNIDYVGYLIEYSTNRMRHTRPMYQYAGEHNLFGMADVTSPPRMPTCSLESRHASPSICD
ncbi:hypothetical protein N7490_010152 [Penicillium lividum]|nr:hypothetical protein N7490_010152 [Penicillium lividum]